MCKKTKSTQQGAARNSRCSRKNAPRFNIALKKVTFFIPLPETMYVRDGTEYPIIEIDDDNEAAAIRFINDQGLSRRIQKIISFFQIPDHSHHSKIQAAFSALSRVIEPLSTPDEEPQLEFPIKQTVATASIICNNKKLDEEMISNLFDELVAHIRQFQKSYSIVTNHQIELLTSKNTALSLPYIVEEINQDGSPLDETAHPIPNFFLTPSKDSFGFYDHEGSEEEIVSILHNMETYSGTLDTFFNIKREASLAFRRGNTMLSVLLFGMASEILLDDLLMLLFWEEGREPNDIAEMLKEEEYKTTSDRIERGLFGQRLGGNWSIDKDRGAMRNWRYHIRDVRNSIAHTGHEPTAIEMQRANDTLMELTIYLTELLCDRLDYYPITVYLFARGSLKKRGLEEKYDKVLTGLIKPSNPWRTFENWRFEVERQRSGNPAEGNRKRAYPAVCLHSSGREIWLMVDESTRLALIIPEQKLGRDMQKSLDEIRSRVGAYRPEKNHLVRLIDVKPVFDKNACTKWIPLYKVSSERSISRWPVSYLVN